MKIGTYTLSEVFPVLMGIVNVTPDSFSDGGRYFSTNSAIDHALKLAGDGADILDIGGESTRPGAEPVSADEEIRRTIPVIEGIRKQSKIPISIDTSKSLVARRAIEAGADMINDISAGRFDPQMFPLAAEKKVPVCLMHMQGKPRTMQANPSYKDIIGEIRDFLSERAKAAMKAGIDKSNIIIDPGIGFGKTAEGNIEIIKNLNQFVKLGFPVLLGTSNKSFIGKLMGLDVKDRLEATLATLAVATDAGVSILRVHNVASAKQFLGMYCLCGR